MATAKIDTVIRQLRRAMLRQVAVGKTDGQLLASFIEQKDEAAFEALVHRHGPMVFGVCRRVVGNHHDAEDAFQATFLVLARKASSVRPRERVANWLHGVALRTAMKVKATIAKRREREKQVTEMPEPEVVQQDQWRDLQPLLDQELNGLPENYRLPILLCDLEGKPIKEAAQQLGWPQGTLASRLARGRKLLAKRLANRGVMLSAGALAVIVSQNVASAGVPTSLMSSTVKAAAMIAAGQAAVAGVVPAQVAALTEGVMKAMLLMKLKTAVAVPLVMALALGSGAGLLYQTQAEGRPKAQEVDVKTDQWKHPATEKDEKPKADKQQVAQDDPHTIRGVWRVISVKPSKKMDARLLATRWLESRWTISTETIEIRMKNDGALGLNYKLDPSKSPKILDLTLLGYRIAAIYALEGDVLQIRTGFHEGSRPKSLTTDRNGNTMLLTLKRDSTLNRMTQLDEMKPSVPHNVQLKRDSTLDRMTQRADENGDREEQSTANKDEKPKPDKERLQGAWQIVSTVVDGNKEKVIGNWTIKGTTLRITCQPKDDVELKTFLRFRLNETTNPKWIDMVGGKADDLFDTTLFDKRFDDADKRREGIYSIAGNTLKICFRRMKGERPTALESKPGSDFILIVLKRASLNDEQRKNEKKTAGLVKQIQSEPASSTSDKSMGFTKQKRSPQEYSGIFKKMLAVIVEHFEHITYANQYDGQIKARTVDAKRPGIIREATVSILPHDDGGLSIAVAVNKVKVAGNKSEVVGRDTDLEQAILRMDAQQDQKDKPSATKPAGTKLKREYKIFDLLDQDDTTAQPLMRLITKTILPRSWSENGGDCTIEYLPEKGILIIQHTEEIHKQVQDLLDALRRRSARKPPPEIKP